MPLTAEDRKMFDRLNKRYKVFRKRGVTSNAWELIKNEMLNIYMDASERGTMDISRINFKQNIFSLSKNIDELIVKSDNEDYRTRVIKDEDLNSVNIVGEVVGIIRNV